LFINYGGSGTAGGLCRYRTRGFPGGKNGTIQACYRVKGKPKGALRVVPAQQRCKRGERKVVWSA
jgi:hypothetical protein